MNTERIEIVNEEGRVIGESTRGEAYEQGLLHRGVLVIVTNPQGQIYLQQRSAQKVIFPLHWDVSVAEHPNPGESFEDAAKRGMREELAIVDIYNMRLLRRLHFQSTEFPSNGSILKERELVEVYLAVYGGVPQINPEEVADGRFVSIRDLTKLSMDGFTGFTPWGAEQIRYILHQPDILNG